MAVCLKMEVEKMEEIFENGMESARMSYYPPCPYPEMVMGLAAHSDGGGLTFLHQLNEVHGLQVNKDGLWFPVNPHDGAFIVNLGDVLEVCSLLSRPFLWLSHNIFITCGGEKESDPL